MEKEENEYSEKLKFVLKTFNELMEKGVEFKPNALASEDIKNLFPNNNVFQKLLNDTNSNNKK